jgi:hypothetical protein
MDLKGNLGQRVIASANVGQGQQLNRVSEAIEKYLKEQNIVKNY